MNVQQQYKHQKLSGTSFTFDKSQENLPSFITSNLLFLQLEEVMLPKAQYNITNTYIRPLHDKWHNPTLNCLIR